MLSRCRLRALALPAPPKNVSHYFSDTKTTPIQENQQVGVAVSGGLNLGAAPHGLWTRSDLQRRYL